MAQKFYKPVKKFVSRKLAIEKLKITGQQFNRLKILCSVYPVIAPERSCFDKEKGWYYSMDDIKKIYSSDAYDTLVHNAEQKRKKDEVLKYNRTDRIHKFCEEEYGLTALVKQKYKSFGDSLCDLGNSVRNLHYVSMLQVHDATSVLDEFYDFVVAKQLLSSAFLAQRGIYFGLNIKSVVVVWQVPYPNNTLAEVVEEKIEQQPVSYSREGLDFLDLEEFSSSDEENELTDLNDPEKLDISLMKYAAPLHEIHTKAVLHKLTKLLHSAEKRKGVFAGLKFNINVDYLNKEMMFVLKSEDAEIVTYDNADYIIADKVESINKNAVYVQPQYIFDCLNKKMLISPSEYFVGKTLPKHVSPFKDILEVLDDRVLKTLSNNKKYKILDKLESLL
ncbi:pescadillo [Enteropsectra breve]|nr:pescadillo [Enteropsectra breve]